MKNKEIDKHFYQTDRLGSITALTDEEGWVAVRYRYDAYGKPLAVLSPWPSEGRPARGEELSNPYRYTGRWYDDETGLYYYRNRYYSPEIGRFMTRDPSKYFDGMNLYAYVNNQPTYFVDPMGLWSTEIHNDIIYQAFKDLTSMQRNAMYRGSKEADSLKYQTEFHAYMHAMRAPWESPESAGRKMNDFVDSKIKKAAELISQGYETQGYFEFGMAIHPLMDSTSPSHRGFQVWSVPTECLGSVLYCATHAAYHHRKETSPSSMETEETVDLLDRAYEDLYRQIEFLTKSNNKKKPAPGSGSQRNAFENSSQPYPRVYEEG